MNFLKACGPAVVAALVTCSFVGEAHAQDKVEVSGTEPDRRLLGSGIFTFGVPYIASVIVAGSSDHPGDHNLYVPVAGPWMDLADRHCANGVHCDDGLNKGLLIVNGIFQGLGALDIISAFVFPETVTVTRAARGEMPPAIAKVQVGPSGVGTGYGLAAIGAF